ncbi:hypothetical protein L249_7136, partial [Ophiocordyceps polyrhachis-furcata BCC 54312]
DFGRLIKTLGRTTTTGPSNRIGFAAVAFVLPSPPSAHLRPGISSIGRVMASAPASVRVSGPPNSSFLVGYPGISATLPRIEGKVEIRPGQGFSMPVPVSLVRICLQRRETIHPDAESLTKRHLGAPRRETADVVGKEVLLFRCSTGKEAESVMAMDLPFVLFIPFGRGGEETNRRIPPASLQLPSRTAETDFGRLIKTLGRTTTTGPSNRIGFAAVAFVLPSPPSAHLRPGISSIGRVMASAPASVRVSGPPNSSFLVGYPGISATLPRIEGKVEIRPGQGFSMPVPVSLVRICLQRRETIHPDAESLTKRHLGAPRRETADVVGKEVLLFRCSTGKEAESVMAMDLPFVLFIPFGRGGEETNRRIPPASLQLPSRTAETYYELVVTIQQGHSNQYKFSFPMPLQRYDTLSTFGMYNKPETKLVTADNVIHLGINLPRWSFGPNDPITVYLKLSPNPDWMTKARRVTIEKITLAIEEEITFNPEGDEPTKKINKLSKQAQVVKMKMPEAGYATNIGLVFPSKDLRDPDGIVKRGKAAFPLYEVGSFTTTSSLYKIEFYVTIKPVVICPLDQQGCKEEMDAIEQAAKDAALVDPNNPMLPARTIVLASDRDALRSLGLCTVGGQKKPFID